MCHPGRPGPMPGSHVGSPGFVPFHSTKSRASSLSYLSESTRAPLFIPAWIETRELAVAGQRRNLEVDRAVAAVGMAVALERLDRLPHRLDVLGIRGARILFDRLEPEGGGVLLERGDELGPVYSRSG